VTNSRSHCKMHQKSYRKKRRLGAILTPGGRLRVKPPNDVNYRRLGAMVIVIIRSVLNRISSVSDQLWNGQPGNRGSITGRGREFSFLYSNHAAAHPTSNPVGNADSFPKYKSAGCEDDQTSPPNSEVKNL
jgi:hypothetical protein